jgi:uncharacterized protein
MTRMILGGLGWCAVALAIAGIIVPGLPTTVFVIAASYCFSRSSPRFERWLRANRWLGPSLQQWASGGGMPRSAKQMAIAVIWTAVLFSSGVLARVHWGLAAGTIAMGAIGTLAILFGVRTAAEQASATRQHVAIPRAAR